MQIETSRPQDYLISSKEFHRLMEIKERTYGYDKNGNKRFKLDKKTNQLKPLMRQQRIPILSEIIPGPMLLVCFKTSPYYNAQISGPAYAQTATIYLDENEAMQVYRDTLNQGYTDAQFCDDTTMLCRVISKNKNGKIAKKYLKFTGEPTNLENYTFKEEEKNQLEVINSFLKPLESIYKVKKITCIIQFDNV